KDHQIHEEDLPLVLERLRAYLRGDMPIFLSEHRIRGDDGGWLWMRARGRAIVRDDDGRVVRIAGTARNIDSIRAKERERRIAGEVMRNMAEAVAVMAGPFSTVAVTPVFAPLRGCVARVE